MLVNELLNKLNLQELVTNRGGLDKFEVDTKGSDLSLGQKQLLCT